LFDQVDTNCGLTIE